MALAYEPRDLRVTWSDERINQLKIFAEQGLSASEIGREMGVSRNAIIGQCNRRGIQLTNVVKSIWFPDRVKLLKELKAEGKSVTEIALALGIRPERVSEKIKKLEARPKKVRVKRAQPEKVQRLIRWGAYSHRIIDSVFLPVEENLSPAHIPVSQRKMLMELENCSCRFPYGEPGQPDFFFCGCPTADMTSGRPYCLNHTRTAYRHDSYVPWGFR